MMTNRQILDIAMAQQATDSNCEAMDFCKTENVVAISKPHPLARKYLALPFFCDLVSYGSNIVASVDESVADTVRAYIDKFPVEHCFETPNLHVLNTGLEKHGFKICFMAEYFLPDVNAPRPQSCGFKIKILERAGFESLYLPEWNNALSARRPQLDMLAAAAFDGDRIIGLAGCSADCDSMWQIGVDVLPEYRRKGIASALTSTLSGEILRRGKVPFYCCAWSNIGSARNAIKSGFRPAWAEITAKSREFTDEMNT